jgi:hypothetical protein
LSSDICWARATASLTLVGIPRKGRSRTNFGGPYGLDYSPRKRNTFGHLFEFFGVLR